MCDYFHPQKSGTDFNFSPFVRPSVPIPKTRGQVRNETTRLHPENERGRYATKGIFDPAGRGIPQTPGRAVFTYSAGGDGDSRSRKEEAKQPTTSETRGKSPGISVARETRAPKERGGTTAANRRARKRSEKSGKAERRTGAESEAGTGGKPPDRADRTNPTATAKPNTAPKAARVPRATGRA